jgi:Site-specific recombinase XerD
MLLYSAGLRVGEMVKLMPEDIDSKRTLIHIKGSKGRKDRYTILSETALKFLRQYWKKYKLGNGFLKVRELEDIFQQGQFGQYLSMQEKKQALGKILLLASLCYVRIAQKMNALKKVYLVINNGIYLI